MVDYTDITQEKLVGKRRVSYTTDLPKLPTNSKYFAAELKLYVKILFFSLIYFIDLIYLI